MRESHALALTIPARNLLRRIHQSRPRAVSASTTRLDQLADHEKQLVEKGFATLQPSGDPYSPDWRTLEWVITDAGRRADVEIQGARDRARILNRR